MGTADVTYLRFHIMFYDGRKLSLTWQYRNNGPYSSTMCRNECRSEQTEWCIWFMKLSCDIKMSSVLSFSCIDSHPLVHYLHYMHMTYHKLLSYMCIHETHPHLYRCCDSEPIKGVNSSIQKTIRKRDLKKGKKIHWRWKEGLLLLKKMSFIFLPYLIS